MPRFEVRVKGFIGLAAAIWLAVGAVGPSGSFAADWPQATSDIPADPSIRFGKLANGMRYAIKANATPKGGVSIRLRFDAGSLNEDDDQQGLAHFLEHMAFRGSKRVPAGEVWNGLQRLGMTAGADANASTSFTETIYKLDLPHNDPATVDAGFLRMRETASELTLDPAAMHAERGPILSEERLRATGSYRAYKARLQFLLPKQPGLDRFPIGRTETIETAPISLIRRFYDEFYRPENAVLVVVGEVDVDRTEARIVSEFGNWHGVAQAGRKPVSVPLGNRGTDALLFTEPTAPSFLMLSWASPWRAQGSLALQRADVLDKIGFEVLSRRLQALPNGAEHPFAGTGIQFSHEFNAANLRTQVFEIKPEDWRPALAVAVREAKRIATFGVTQQEVDGVTGDLRVSLQSLANRSGTRSSASISNEIVNSIGDEEIVTSREESLREFDDILRSLTPADVSTAVAKAMGTGGPLVFLSSPVAIGGGTDEVRAALDAALATDVTDVRPASFKPWPYVDFGTPGKVAERQTVADLGTTMVRYENGLRVTIKPTRFQADQIQVSLKIGDGRVGVPGDHSNVYWAIQRDAWIDGGLKAMSHEDMKRSLTGKAYGVRANLLDNGLALIGETRPDDLTTQLQVFTAYVTAPGWRPEGIDSARTEQANQSEQLKSSPSGVLRRDLSFLLSNGDRRWAFPSREDIDGIKVEDVKALLDPQLDAAAMEMVVVGDVDVDRVLASVASTLGALPARASPRAPEGPNLRVIFPEPTGETPKRLFHKGRADQGIALLAWPTPDLFSDTQRARSLRIMERVMQTRLTEQLRIQDGATYSPGVSLRPSDVFPGYGYLATYAELPPAKMQLFFNVADSIATDLATTIISADELDRARKPRIAALEAAEQTNGFWIETLTGAQANPKRLDLIRTSISELERVTAEDIQRMAQTYLSLAKSWKLTIEPEAKVEPLVK